MEIDFSSIWGQEVACSALVQNLSSDRVASSYLFAGPQGTGKTSAAMIFAKSLMCDSSGLRPCGDCRACRMVEGGSHPDFILIEPIGIMIKIGQMRELFAKLSLKSYSGGRKVCVMQEAEKMNKESVNAFLKTLEEPPEGTIIILVSSNPSALLPTIISRCRMVRFVPMAEETLADLLVEKGRVEDAGEAARLAHLAEGRPGRALSDGMERLKEIDDEAGELLSRLMEMKPDELILWAEGWKTRRNDLPVFMDRLLDLLRLAGKANYLLPSGRMAPVMEILCSVPGERLLEGFEALLKTKPDLRFNPNIQLFLESNLFNLQSILGRGVAIAS